MEKFKLNLPHGGYQSLESFKVARLCYEITWHFARRVFPEKDRTRDQMIQAARSGVQNIVEGNCAAATSAKTEIKLTQVARASLEELKMDYRDYLDFRRQPLMAKDDLSIQKLAAQRPRDLKAFTEWLGKIDNLEERLVKVANGCFHLCCVASFLLHRQIQSMEKRFLEEGGYTERIYRERVKRKRSQK